MGRGGSGKDSAKCLAYLNSRKRVKNKAEELEKRIMHLKPEAQEKIRKACPIGRGRERGSGKA
jgi:hypothetical protein